MTCKCGEQANTVVHYRNEPDENLCPACVTKLLKQFNPEGKIYGGHNETQVLHTDKGAGK